MGNKYLEAEKDFRIMLDVFGNIKWAESDDENLLIPYKRLVDIFGDRLGNNLSNDEKKNWIETMIRNSGYSDDIEFNDGVAPFLYVKKPPMTLLDNLKGKYVAASIYPLTNGFASKIHEGIHFLANYGPKRKRIIKNGKDIPLANIMGNFFRFMKNPKILKEIIGITDKERIKNLEQNPFLFNYNEHSNEEHFESGITAANAYFTAKKQGEQAGIDYIINLIEQAQLIRN